jgi:hypothetical protein
MLMSMAELRGSNVVLQVYDSKYTEITEGKENKDSSNSLFQSSKMNGNFNLQHKYTYIGHSIINFYKILSENDNMVLKQSSQFFKQFSKFYQSDTLTNNNNNEINKTEAMNLCTENTFNKTNYVWCSYRERI